MKNVTSQKCYLTLRLSCFNIPIGQSGVAKCQISISFLKEKNPIGVDFFTEDLICSFHVKGTAHTSVSRGRDKRAYIAALRKAKIYPPRQAAAAAMHELHCRNARAAIHKMECSSSCALRQLVHWCGATVGLKVPQYKPFLYGPCQSEMLRKLLRTGSKFLSICILWGVMYLHSRNLFVFHQRDNFFIFYLKNVSGRNKTLNSFFFFSVLSSSVLTSHLVVMH